MVRVIISCPNCTTANVNRFPMIVYRDNPVMVKNNCILQWNNFIG